MPVRFREEHAQKNKTSHSYTERLVVAAREELRLRCENLEQEMEKMRARLDDLLSAAEQTRSLKVFTRQQRKRVKRESNHRLLLG